mmetsp:Transcript_27031/g.78885  ORF Transcript_27031/g.78885 Transcript_27031/m.78885 type:complete len:235 (-) Transcript_27031:176-880(-)
MNRPQTLRRSIAPARHGTLRSLHGALVALSLSLFPSLSLSLSRPQTSARLGPDSLYARVRKPCTARRKPEMRARGCATPPHSAGTTQEYSTCASPRHATAAAASSAAQRTAASSHRHHTDPPPPRFAVPHAATEGWPAGRGASIALLAVNPNGHSPGVAPLAVAAAAEAGAAAAAVATSGAAAEGEGAGAASPQTASRWRKMRALKEKAALASATSASASTAALDVISSSSARR